ncbi:MAG TPA: type II toxin-antitoxin system antitoxin SocA domain-containing protein [Pilimelia sp.]|nr:type II toxin-antitoxin system antitoxin SocA domain-containing protein [Pilimelia sp.]
MYDTGDRSVSLRQPRRPQPYADRMAVSAREVAAALRERLPGLGRVKLHKLLYYCQGHHLATFGEPLFSDTISAWDMGPVVGTLWREEKDGAPAGEPGSQDAELGEAGLNTVGYVVSRYGSLTGKDLENLSHSETPWQTANRVRQPGGRVTIRQEWIREYFLTDGNPAAGEEDVPLDSEAVAEWLAGAQEPPAEPGRAPDRDRLLAMRAAIAARLARAG